MVKRVVQQEQVVPIQQRHPHTSAGYHNNAEHQQKQQHHDQKQIQHIVGVQQHTFLPAQLFFFLFLSKVK